MLYEVTLSPHRKALIWTDPTRGETEDTAVVRASWHLTTILSPDARTPYEGAAVKRVELSERRTDAVKYYRELLLACQVELSMGLKALTGALERNAANEAEIHLDSCDSWMMAQKAVEEEVKDMLAGVRLFLRI